MKILIDTNVIVDVLLKREPFYKDSYDCMKCAIENDVEMYVSASAVTDIFYLLRKNCDSQDEAKVNMKTLLQMLLIADTTAKDINMALSHEMKDFEDAVVDTVAFRMNAEYIITRNVKDFAKSKTKALTPADYLKMKMQ